MSVGILKSLFVGALLFTAGAFGQKNLCQSQRYGTFCNGNWGLSRADMPQIVDGVRHEFLASLPPSHVTREWLDPDGVTYVQNQINADSVFNIIDSHQRGGGESL